MEAYLVASRKNWRGGKLMLRRQRLRGPSPFGKEEEFQGAQERLPWNNYQKHHKRTTKARVKEEGVTPREEHDHKAGQGGKAAPAALLTRLISTLWGQPLEEEKHSKGEDCVPVQAHHNRKETLYRLEQMQHMNKPSVWMTKEP